MKKFFKVLLAIVMIVVLFTLPTIALADWAVNPPRTRAEPLLW